MKRLVAVVLLQISLFILVDAQATCVKNVTEPYRLPRTVIPHHYNLSITPQLQEPYELSGIVSINITVQEETTCIVIHQGGLQFSSVEFTSSEPTSTKSSKPVNPQPIQPSEITYDNLHQFGIMTFNEALPLGEAILTIKYSGYLNQNNATGFFVSPLELLAEVPETKEQHEQMMREYQGPTMLATQFEGPYARMAYPCFDEPELKATFECAITVYNTSEVTVLFNTMEQSSMIDKTTGALITTFEPTPVPISTYLVAFAIGNFEYLEASANGIRYRIYCSPGKSQYGAFSLNISMETISYFTKLWDIGYPFNKLDQIAVPRIFQDGMENIGLVTYWPPWILDDPQYYQVDNYQMTTMVVTHELSHMWFGDTVTLPWWSETYNNEGFARYLQYIAAEHLFPSWNVWEEGGKNAWFNFVYTFMKTDAFGLSPPEIQVQSYVSGSVESVSNAFAGPTYPKGACLNRYFNTYLGNIKWNYGLGYHLKKWKYQNPTTHDLVYDLDESSDFKYKLQEKFIPWLRLQSFPVISLSQDQETITFSQTPVSKYISEYTSALWFIEFQLNMYYNYNNDTYQPTGYQLIQFQGETFSLGGVVPGDLITIGNELHTSYMIIRYSNELWPQTFQYFSVPSYDEVLREVFVQDIIILTKMSHTTVRVLFEYLNHVRGLESLTLLPTLLSQWFDISEALQYQPYYETTYKNDLRYNLINATENAISLSSQPLSSLNSTQQSYISSLLMWSAYYGDENSINYGLTLFTQNSSSLPSYLEKYVYFVVGKYGSQQQYQSLESLLSQTTSAITQQNILFGLAASENTTDCTSFLSSQSSASSSTQLSISSNMLYYSSNCQSLAWANIQVVGEEMLKAEGSAATTSILAAFDGAFSNWDYYFEVESFLASNSNYFTAQQIQNSLNRIHINIDLVNANLNFPNVALNT